MINLEFFPNPKPDCLCDRKFSLCDTKFYSKISENLQSLKNHTTLSKDFYSIYIEKSTKLKSIQAKNGSTGLIKNARQIFA